MILFPGRGLSFCVPGSFLLLLLAGALVLVAGASGGSSGTFNLSPASPPLFPLQASLLAGPLEDARCRAETVERANSLQLQSILQELVAAPTMRTFNVGLKMHIILRTSDRKRECVACVFLCFRCFLILNFLKFSSPQNGLQTKQVCQPAIGPSQFVLLRMLD